MECAPPKHERTVRRSCGKGVTLGEDSNTDLVRRVIEEIWNLGNLHLADALFTASYINHGGLIPDLVRGPEAIKISVVLYRTAFPDLHVTMETLVATGEMVDLQWSAHSARSSVVASRGRSGQQMSLTGSTRSHVTSGKINESWTIWDSTDARFHLGIRPPNGVKH